MLGQKSRLETATHEAEIAVAETNKSISRLGEHTGEIYKSLTDIQELFDRIRNVPTDKRIQYEKIKKARLEWKSQAERIEKNYKDITAKGTGAGAAGIGTGVAVAAMGPTVAMGIATTYGVASTGISISALSGAAATNAALAWLGGGALAVGGGGMAAGQALLAMAGPIGWAIAGASLVGSGIVLWIANDEKTTLEDIFVAMSRRDINSYNLAIVEINERIKRIQRENKMLKVAIRAIRSFGLNYDAMTVQQQYTLGTYVNMMRASTQLLINPIMGLQPKYTERDFEAFAAEKRRHSNSTFYQTNRDIIIAFANMLYGIELDSRKIGLLTKSFKENKQFLKSAGITREKFDRSIIEAAVEGLRNVKKTERECR